MRIRKDLIEVPCSYCRNPVPKRKSEISKGTYKTHFCNRICMGMFKKSGEFSNCKQCGQPVYRMKVQFERSKSGNVFCSRKCATIINNKDYKTGEDHPNYIEGKGSYRPRALREKGKFCSNKGCTISKLGIPIDVKMLDVDHIDGNRSNNKIENLQVLCVWCHAEKTRYNKV